MSNEIIFYTQLVSILGFIAALFVLYRVLVKQKDATIQLLKEKNEYISLQLIDLKNQQPDILVKQLSGRAKALTEELERLSQDKEANEQQIQDKEKELNSTAQELKKIQAQYKRTEELMSEFLCPHCNAPMLLREFAYESVEYEDREIDVDHEHTVYECGLEITDGKETEKCGSF